MFEEICKVLEPYPEAVTFALSYKDYIHKIDDLIDSEIRPSPNQILEMAAKASETFTLPFWIQFGPSLILLEQTINLEYGISVEWEKESNWKLQAADSMRHAGCNMFLAILLITIGREQTREFASKLRENAHKLHLEDFKLKIKVNE